jgi:hypothetical protein
VSSSIRTRRINELCPVCGALPDQMCSQPLLNARGSGACSYWNNPEMEAKAGDLLRAPLLPEYPWKS